MDHIVLHPQPHTSRMDPQTQGLLYKNLGVGRQQLPWEHHLSSRDSGLLSGSPS